MSTFYGAAERYWKNNFPKDVKRLKKEGRLEKELDSLAEEAKHQLVLRVRAGEQLEVGKDRQG